MEALPGLALLDGYAAYRAEGEMCFEDAIGLAGRVIAYCRERGIERVLLDGRRLSGFGPLDATDRFRLSEEMARAARATVKVAIVVRPELLSLDLFGVMVARNRGLFTNSFASEVEAVAWLKDPNAT